MVKNDYILLENDGRVWMIVDTDVMGKYVYLSEVRFKKSLNDFKIKKKEIEIESEDMNNRVKFRSTNLDETMYVKYYLKHLTESGLLDG